MIALLFGVVALVVFIWASKRFATANTASLSRNLRFAGAFLAILGGVILTATGRGAIGIPLLGFAIPLMMRWRSSGGRSRTRREPGGSSTVRSAMLEMSLDLDSGAMNGAVLSGSFAGRGLNELAQTELLALHAELRHADAEGARLLEAYLDRRVPGWREHLKGDAGARGHDAAGQGPMTQEEAYQILGLDPGAGASEVRRAHRELMKKLHPDQGGSNYLASRVNQAKDVLTRSER
jgi:hypothetical protein